MGAREKKTATPILEVPAPHTTLWKCDPGHQRNIRHFERTAAFAAGNFALLETKVDFSCNFPPGYILVTLKSDFGDQLRGKSENSDN
jgi:hypothetical protein